MFLPLPTNLNSDLLEFRNYNRYLQTNREFLESLIMHGVPAKIGSSHPIS
jgi:hypothetical protein